jgi:hypothetical protein
MDGLGLVAAGAFAPGVHSICDWRPLGTLPSCTEFAGAGTRWVANPWPRGRGPSLIWTLRDLPHNLIRVRANAGAPGGDAKSWLSENGMIHRCETAQPCNSTWPGSGTESDRAISTVGNNARAPTGFGDNGVGVVVH